MSNIYDRVIQKIEQIQQERGDLPPEGSTLRLGTSDVESLRTWVGGLPAAVAACSYDKSSGQERFLGLVIEQIDAYSHLEIVPLEPEPEPETETEPK